MSLQADVTLNSVVYSSSGTSNGITKWVNRAGGILNSFKKLTQAFVTGSGARKLTKVTFRLELPVVATADSACSCIGALLRTSSAQIDFWVDPNASAAERADLVAQVKDLAASAAVSNAVSDLNPEMG